MLHIRNGKWKVVFAMLGGITLSFIIALVLMQIVGMIGGIFHIQGITDFMKTQQKTFDLQGMEVYVLVGATMEIGFILGPIIISKLVLGEKISILGLIPIRKNWRDLIWGLIIGCASISLAFLLLVMTRGVEIESFGMIDIRIFILQLIAYILVGFGEEILFRGLFFGSLRNIKSKTVLFFIPALIFGCVHITNSGVTVLSVINLIVLGLVWCFAFYKSGSIWMPIGIHTMWNFFQGVVFGFSVSGNQDISFVKLKNVSGNLWNGGAFGAEGGFAATIAIIGMFFCIKYYYRNSKYQFTK